MANVGEDDILTNDNLITGDLDTILAHLRRMESTEPRHLRSVLSPEKKEILRRRLGLVDETTILQMIVQWLDGTEEERAQMVWPQLRGDHYITKYGSYLEPGVDEHNRDLYAYQNVRTYAITEELYNRIFPNGDAGDPTIAREEWHGSPYRIPPDIQVLFETEDDFNHMTSKYGYFAQEGANYHWELEGEEADNRLFDENQGLMYNDDYRAEINRLYNLDRNGEPLNLTREERMQNPSEVGGEVAAAAQRVTNEARRLAYWLIHEDTDERDFDKALKERRVTTVKPAHKGGDESEFGKIIKPYKKHLSRVDDKGAYFNTRFGVQKLRDDERDLYLKNGKGVRLYLYKW